MILPPRGMVAAIIGPITELRRAIHRHPELAFEERATTDRVASMLSDRGLSPRVRPDGVGLVVDVGTGARMVGFRADLDALPIHEPPDSPHASRIPGVMHACGHDAHTAIAVGVALTLSELELSGRVRIIFQPGEETFPGGAMTMVRERVTDGLSAIVAFHVDPTLLVGQIGLRTGPITGSADRFILRLEGPGGHTARPHRGVDLVFAAGLLATQLPGLLDRLIDARRPLTVVFGRIRGGTVENVIPTELEMGGTVRTLDRELFDELPIIMEGLASQIVAPTGAKVTLDYLRGIPPVVNDAEVVDAARVAITASLGPSAVTATTTSMGAEDFSRYLDEVPGAMFRLGSGGLGSPDLHSSGFVFNDEALEVGVIAGTATVLRLLNPYD